MSVRLIIRWENTTVRDFICQDIPRKGDRISMDEIGLRPREVLSVLWQIPPKDYDYNEPITYPVVTILLADDSQI